MFLFSRSQEQWQLPTRRCNRATRWSCIVIFFVVAYVALWFLGGDIGFWNDDYYLRGAWLQNEGAVHVLPSPTPFDKGPDAPWLWRPALTVGVTSMVGAWWETPWLVNLVMASLHAATAALLGLFLKACGRTSGVAFAGSLLYLTLPQHFEAAFWANGFLVGVGTGFLLIVGLLFVAWAKGLRTWWMVLLLCVTALMTACTHEQPAGAFVALPLFFFAARPANERLSRSWFAMLLPLVLMAACVGVYIALQIGQQSDGGVGGAGKIVKPSLWPLAFANRLRDTILGMGVRSVGLSGWRLCIDGIRQNVTAFVVAMLTLVTAGIVLVRASKTCSTIRPPRLFVSEESRRILFACAGIVIALGSLIPLAVVESGVRPRMLAPVIVGMILFGATIVDRLIMTSIAKGTTKTLCTTLTALLIFITGFGTACMIGIQRAYQLRWRETLSIMLDMRTKLSDPGAHAVFMPVRCDDWPVKTSSKRFNDHFVGPYYWSFGFSSMPLVTYGRTDLDSSFVHSKVNLVIVATPTHGLRPGPFRYGFAEDAPENAADILAAAGWQREQLPQTSKWIAWDRVVPFVTRPDGGVDFVTELAFRKGGLDGELVFSVFPPRTMQAAKAGAFPELRWIIDLPSPPNPTK